MVNGIMQDFNTSNVTIQHKGDQPILYRHKHFNTSNVTIQLLPFLFLSQKLRYFNTSNVTIQLYVLSHFLSVLFISIHLMLLFNIQCRLYIYDLINFNTSNVTIQRYYTNYIKKVFTFQYI